MTKSTQKSNFISGGIVFNSIACDCEIGVTPLSKGRAKHVFHLYPKDERLQFNFKAGKELINASNGKQGAGRAVLPDLLAIRDGNMEDAKTFIENHGYFLPLNHTGNNLIDAESMFRLINRLKATFNLLAALSESEKNAKHKKDPCTNVTSAFITTNQY